MKFLTRNDVAMIHQDQIKRYGGRAGIRDEGLLLSALAQPQSSFGKVEMNPSPHDKAAAYLFHLTSNHPFVDGNKRVGLVAALLFLKLNGLNIKFDSSALEALVMRTASGRVQKKEIAAFFSKT